MDIFNRFFGSKEGAHSKRVAKERLRLVLVHDRASVAPHVMEMLKEDIVAVISKYMEIDDKDMEITLNRDSSSVALLANIPILSVKRSGMRVEGR